jgi:hypothetical protein
VGEDGGMQPRCRLRVVQTLLHLRSDNKTQQSSSFFEVLDGLFPRREGKKGS